MARAVGGIRPEHLNDQERRVYEFAREPMPLAEIAVRLGVATSDTDRRVQALLLRLGLEDRAALRRQFPPAPATSLNDGPPESEPVRRSAQMRRITLVIVAVVMLGLASLAAWSWSSQQGRARETQAPISASTPGEGAS